MILLKQLLENTDYKLVGNSEAQTTGITYDSRKVEKGNIFVCMHGQHVNGEKFIREAVDRGATVIVNDRQVEKGPGYSFEQVIVQNTRSALAILSRNFYSDPSSKITMIGVTGTNGKTTTTYLLESIFEQAGKPAAVFGTIEYRFGKESYPSDITTPQSSDLQPLINKAVQMNYKAVAMEVSSHSLSLDRVEGVEFDAAIFTNLTRDHLDYHKTFDEYFNAKLKLFKMLEIQGKKNTQKFAVVNVDDNWGTKILENIKSPALTYSISNIASDVYASEIKLGASSTQFSINYRGRKIKINTALIGKHNVSNILASAACTFKMGVSDEVIKKGIEHLKSVPGRLDKVDYGQDFTIVVDYAHTDDALKNVLSLLREVCKEKIITVFGCGGDRDRSKRPIMGNITTELSDYVIITSDNPRTENPEKIIFDIEVGVRRAGRDNYESIIDREQAIFKALKISKKGDVVLLAGKGHENYQVIGENKIPFSDKEIVRKFFNK